MFPKIDKKNTLSSGSLRYRPRGIAPLNSEMGKAAVNIIRSSFFIAVLAYQWHKGTIANFFLVEFFTLFGKQC